MNKIAIDIIIDNEEQIYKLHKMDSNKLIDLIHSTKKLIKKFRKPTNKEIQHCYSEIPNFPKDNTSILDYLRKKITKII
jgi:hypothetical protein